MSSYLVLTFWSFWRDSIPALLNTVDKLLSKSSEAQFILSYQSRARNTENYLFDKAKELGFLFHSVPLESFYFFGREERNDLFNLNSHFLVLFQRQIWYHNVTLALYYKKSMCLKITTTKYLFLFYKVCIPFVIPAPSFCSRITLDQFSRLSIWKMKKCFKWKRTSSFSAYLKSWSSFRAQVIAFSI